MLSSTPVPLCQTTWKDSGYVCLLVELLCILAMTETSENENEKFNGDERVAEEEDINENNDMEYMLSL